MGRKKTTKNKFEDTSFATRIYELQSSHGYSDKQVMGMLEKESFHIENVQTYQSYKCGKRQPGLFDDALVAFAKIYDVSTDYLLGKDDTPNLTFKKAQDATGLSITSIRVLSKISKSRPELMELMNVIISGLDGEDITYYDYIYQQMYDDYKDSINTKYYQKAMGSGDSEKETQAQGFFAEKQRKEIERFISIQSLYKYWYEAMTIKASGTFDKQIEDESKSSDYRNSTERIAELSAAMEESDKYLVEQGLIKQPKATIKQIGE